MDFWVKAQGKLVVDEAEGHVFLALGFDILKYYLWFIEREVYKTYATPRKVGHVTLADRTIHKGVRFDRAKAFAGKTIDFEYNLDIVEGGKTKGFKNFYFKVRSDEIIELKKHINVNDNGGFKGLHLTVCNSKNNGERPFWWKMIEVKK